MRSLRTLPRHTIIVIVGLCVVAAPAVWAVVGPTAASALDVSASHVELTCGMDMCMVEASYTLPVRRDNHDVTFRWQTRPAAGFEDNRSEVLRRTMPSGIGQRGSSFGGYRYSVVDVVWHSDIRCDASVHVTVTGDHAFASSREVRKQVPTEPDNAYCSAYGVTG